MRLIKITEHEHKYLNHWLLYSDDRETSQQQQTHPNGDVYLDMLIDDTRIIRSTRSVDLGGNDITYYYRWA